MCIRLITHWQPCRHQRCTGIDICEYAEAHPGLDPSDCPKGENIFSDGASEQDCKICRERGRERERRDDDRDGRGEEWREHSEERRGRRSERREESGSIESGSVESDERRRDGHREDRHERSEKDDGGGDDDNGKGEEKKDGKDPGRWDGAAALALAAAGYFAEAL